MDGSTGLARSRKSFGQHKVIDVDTHLSEPHDLWTSRASARWRDRVPQVKMYEGKRSWVIDGDKCIGAGANPISTVAKDGSKWPGLELLNHQIEEVHPASYDAKARVGLMDAEGITAQIVYPNVLGFGGQAAAKVDMELRNLCIQLYNDAMVEFQQDSGQRIFPMALLPWWDPQLSAREAERCQRMGLRGININSDPHTHVGKNGDPLPNLGDPYWDPIWEVCTDLNLPVNFHIGASEQAMDWYGSAPWPGMPDDVRAALGGAMLFFNNGRVLGNILFSGMLDRYPKLKMVSVESGIGWVPFLLDALNHQYGECVANSKLELKPAEYFARNCYACFWFERRDLSHTIKAVGVDNVMFETDFPHPICLYPADDVNGAMADLTEAERDKVLNGNAQRVYNISLD